MDKVRIHEIAKELGIKSKDVVDKAAELGMDVKDASSAVSPDDAEKLMNYVLTGIREEPVEKLMEYILNQKVNAYSTQQHKQQKEKTGLKIVKKKDKNSIVINRLKLLKLSLELKDYDISKTIATQTLNINFLHENVRQVVEDIKNGKYSSSLEEIELLLKEKQSIDVTFYVDTELQELKDRLKILEHQFQKLLEQKIEYLNDIEEFNQRYSLHVGDIIKDILALKKEILYKQNIKQQKAKEKYKEDAQTFEDTKSTIEELKETISQLEDALKEMDEDDENYDEISKAYQELQNELGNLEDDLRLLEEELNKAKEFIEEEEIEKEYENVSSAYEEFENEYNYIKDELESKIDISEEEKKELKKLYKKAARLCHPDIVPDELKEKAHTIMQKLNEAYSKQDIKEVKKILQSLENGDGFELSSDSINDKELLKEKIKEYKENIKNIESEIEEIKRDETYIIISDLDDWDEYFEEVKRELKEEEESLKAKLKELLDDVEEWIQVLWDWADENYIPEGKLSRDPEKIVDTKVMYFIGFGLKELPKEICNLKNLEYLVLWDNDLEYLPKEIVQLKKIKKINLRGNARLKITLNQKSWLEELKSRNAEVLIDNVAMVDDVKSVGFDETIIQQDSIDKIFVELTPSSYLTSNEAIRIRNSLYGNNLESPILTLEHNKKNVHDNLAIKVYCSGVYIGHILKYKNRLAINEFCFKENKQLEDIQVQYNGKNLVLTKKKKATIEQATSYSKFLNEMELATFEKIRRYCNNLVDAQESDTMQEYLAENGKMYKALIYDALEQFIENLDGDTITLIDWGCAQGIGSSLILDYIKEKQLEITVDQIILIDNDNKAISRAIIHIEALKQNNIEIVTVNSDNSSEFEKIKHIKNKNSLNIIVNDKFPIHILEKNFELLDQAYFMCVSNADKNFIDKIYDKISNLSDVQNLSIRDGKIGRFDKFERVFIVDYYELPF